MSGGSETLGRLPKSNSPTAVHRKRRACALPGEKGLLASACPGHCPGSLAAQDWPFLPRGTWWGGSWGLALGG